MFPSVSLNSSFIDGWLAGDGHLRLGDRHRTVTAEMHTSKYSYASYIWARFASMGFSLPPVFRYDRASNSGRTRPGGYTSFKVNVRAHPSLTEQYRRWYFSGIKILPADFCISPESLLQWYLGDGSLERGRTPRIVVARAMVPDLALLLSQILYIFGPRVAIHAHAPSTWLIYFGGPTAKLFFDYVGLCPVSEYSYRWPGAR